jgi:hypothetical protein
MSITTKDIPEESIGEYTAQSGGVIDSINPDYHPLTHLLLINKFKLQKASSQKLGASVKRRFELRPLQLFTESKQNDKQFVLTAFCFKPVSGIYSDVQLNEYDNSTDISLNLPT